MSTSGYRGKNYEQGAKGENRIRDVLEEYAVVESTPGRYPDLLMTINDTKYGVECKTIKSVLTVGEKHRMGCAKISREEMMAMNALPGQDIIPCLIVEIRPRTGRRRPYFYVPWELVQERYVKTSPRMLTLRYYWILDFGLNLRDWLKRQREIMEGM